MDFTFVGKFRILGGTCLAVASGRPNESIYPQNTLCLTNDPNGKVTFGMFGVIKHANFTVWKTTPNRDIAGEQAIVIRADNGLYLEQRAEGQIAASATDPNNALLFIRRIILNPDNDVEPHIGSVLRQQTNYWNQLLLIYKGPDQWDARMDDPLVYRPIPENALTLSGFTAEGKHMPTPAYNQAAFGVQFYDHTPTLDGLKNPDIGPRDLSWLYWPNVNFAGVDLANSDLRGAYLSGSDMTQANLTGANVKDAMLNNVNLKKANLVGVDFSKTKVSGANFAGADLMNASFVSCDLANTLFVPVFLTEQRQVGSTHFGISGLGRGIDFPIYATVNTRSPLEGTDFSSCTLNNDPISNVWHEGSSDTIQPFGATPQFSTNPDRPTKFCKATLTFNIINLNWSCLDLTDATINGLPLDLSALQASHLIAPRIDLSGRILKNAIFDHADLTGAQFMDADLTGASFVEAKLAGANFSYATLDQANFASAQLGNLPPHSAADLSNANMRGTNFSNANLDKCNLGGVQWYGPNATGYMASLQDADLSDANLGALPMKQAHLDGAIFDRAILIGAKLNGVTAKDTKFRHAHLQGVDFTDAKLDGAKLNDAAVYFDHGVPLFQLTKSKYIGDLNNAIVSDDLKRDFTSAGYDLDAPSVISDPSGGWTLSNPAHVVFPILEDSHGALNVYDSDPTHRPPPRPLFQLRGRYTADLNKAVISNELRTEFMTAGYFLLDTVWVKVGQPGWSLWNDPTTRLGCAYAKFRIIESANDRLTVCGADIWVTQVKGINESQTIVETPVATIFDKCTLSEETVFPNGEQYPENKRKSLTSEMMMAHQPPTPPKCVTTGEDFLCAPNIRKGPRIL